MSAVYYNKIQALPENERPAYVQKLRAEYADDVDLFKIASEAVVDDVVPGAELRPVLAARLSFYVERYEPPARRKHGVVPV